MYLKKISEFIKTSVYSNVFFSFTIILLCFILYREFFINIMVYSIVKNMADQEASNAIQKQEFKIYKIKFNNSCNSILLSNKSKNKVKEVKPCELPCYALSLLLLFPQQRKSLLIMYTKIYNERIKRFERQLKKWRKL